MPSNIDQLLSEGLAKAERATPLDDKHKLIRYDHGGGRLYREDGKDRDLLADFYDEDNRELYYWLATHALTLLRELARIREERLKWLREAEDGWEEGTDEEYAVLRRCSADVLGWT